MVQFFKEYVPNAKGKNVDVVSKFVGDPNKDIAEIEASLDIQYIMGVAPNVKTQFWYYASNDFCLGLKTWTQDGRKNFYGSIFNHHRLLQQG